MQIFVTCNQTPRDKYIKTPKTKEFQDKISDFLTLSGAALKGRECSLGPPQVWGGCWGLWFQILVITSYLTQIDTRQKDLQLSDT